MRNGGVGVSLQSSHGLGGLPNGGWTVISAIAEKRELLAELCRRHSVSRLEFFSRKPNDGQKIVLGRRPQP